MARDKKTVYFAHGKESGPWGTKIMALADVARAAGFTVESPDYQGMDKPDTRRKHLLSLQPKADCLVLVGSSMGGHVSAFAAAELCPAGLFLMAPALYMPYPGWDGEPDIPTQTKISVVHGWRDDIIPVEHATRFAQRHHGALHLLDTDHMLTEALPDIESLFAHFLNGLY